MTGLLAASGAVVAAILFVGGSPGLGVVEFVIFGVLAYLVSPLVFPRSVDAAHANRLGVDEGRPIVYWRPGCPYCLRLRVRLGRDAGRASWVNIWRDPAGAAAVRAIAGGDETVPSVVLGAQSFVNPDPGWLRDRLRDA